MIAIPRHAATVPFASILAFHHDNHKYSTY
jgi:hypothetical protein